MKTNIIIIWFKKFIYIEKWAKNAILNKLFCKSKYAYHTVGENVIVASKCEIVVVLSNDSFFQYCDSNIRLFSIAPCKVIS